jgi:hypothetical protein
MRGAMPVRANESAAGEQGAFAVRAAVDLIRP